MQSNLFSRREVLSSALAAGAGLVLLPALESFASGETKSPDFAAGRVFDEAKRDQPGGGIASVYVSNGRDVVKTDSAGKYRIEVRDGDVLFVIKPAHWMTSLDHYNLPKFYYIHRPNGSPQWRPTGIEGADKLDPMWFWKGTSPTGPLPASIDFSLRRRDEPDEFQIILFGDTQVSHDKQIDYMARGTVAELVNAPGIAFGISVGDLVNVGMLNLFGPINEVQAQTGFPWYCIPGNHDQNLVTDGDVMAEEQYRTEYGPTVYGFEYGPVSFLMLGNVRREAMQAVENAATAAPGTARPAASPYHCGLRDDQWQFVENYLKTVPPDRQLVIVMHMEMSMRWPANAAFTKRLLSLISGRPHTFSISGHTHVQNHWFFGKDAGFDGPGEHHQFNTICVRGAGYRGMFDELQIPTCQAEDGTPAGYSYITFTKTDYKIRYKPSRQPADHQMNVFVPAIMKPAETAAAKVLVNVFAGSKRSQVRMRINGGSWLAMQLKPQADPSLAWVLDQQKKPESWLGSHYPAKDKPAECSHIWEAPLAASLKPGAHTLEVETVDMFGQRDSKMTLFRVKSDSGSPSNLNASEQT